MGCLRVSQAHNKCPEKPTVSLDVHAAAYSAQPPLSRAVGGCVPNQPRCRQSRCATYRLLCCLLCLLSCLLALLELTAATKDRATQHMLVGVGCGGEKGVTEREPPPQRPATALGESSPHLLLIGFPFSSLRSSVYFSGSTNSVAVAMVPSRPQQQCESADLL